MSTLSRDQILGADDQPRERVEVPEWKGHVFVRSMSGAERDSWEASLVAAGEGRNLANARARLAVLCTVDEQGNRLFSAEDADVLGKKAAKPLDRIFRAAMRLNARTKEEVEKVVGE